MNKVVIKIGTKVLTGSSTKPDEVFIKDFAEELSKILKSGVKAIIVSSGAIGSGMGLLGIKKRPSDVSELQALASIGQTQHYFHSDY